MPDIPLPSVLLGGVAFTPEDAERQWVENMAHLECPICHEGTVPFVPPPPNKLLCYFLIACI